MALHWDRYATDLPGQRSATLTISGQHSAAVSYGQRPSAPVSGHQLRSAVISSGQRPSAPVSGHQLRSAAISSGQQPSAPVSSCSLPYQPPPQTSQAPTILITPLRRPRPSEPVTTDSDCPRYTELSGLAARAGLVPAVSVPGPC